MRRPLTRDEVQDPQRVMYRMINDYIHGKLDDNRILFRASVVAIDHSGGQFEIDPANPKNSIRARIITDGIDANTSDEDLPIFWPLFPHSFEPIKEKEHVYVLFEDPARTHGLWISRIPEPLTVDSSNYVAGTKKYVEEPRNELTDLTAEKVVAQLTSTPTYVPVSDDFTIEESVPFTARVGDKVLHGSNNTLIVLGRDRPLPDKALGQRSDAGTIDVVVGRLIPEEMNLLLDKSRVYTSAKTNVDVSLQLLDVRSDGDLTPPSPAGAPAVAIISDEIRILARNNLKVVVVNGDLTFAAKKINLGNQAPEAAVLGDTLKGLLTDLISAIQKITVNTSVGPSAPKLINSGSFISIADRLDSILSTNVKVK